jgi:hypothetical protein
MEFTNENVFTGLDNTVQQNYYCGTSSSTVTDCPSPPYTPGKITLKGEANVDQLPPNLYSAFQQVKDGYHICLFGYGYSGSGKTYTLLGNKDNKGLLHYGLESLDYKKIEIHGIYELYADMSIIKTTGPVDPSKYKIKGNIHMLYGQEPNIDSEVIVKEEKDFNKHFKSIKINKELVTLFSQEQDISRDLDLLTSTITSYRSNIGIANKIDHNRIKATPNNPESSRSHLFITFKLTFSNNTIGYITIVDMAGQENPYNIQKVLFSSSYTVGTIMEFLNIRENTDFANDVLTKLSSEYLRGYGYIKPTDRTKTSIMNAWTDMFKSQPSAHKKDAAKALNTQKTNKETEITNAYFTALDILKEGFFINETLNHLRYFFKSKSSILQAFTKQEKTYDVDNFYVMSEEKTIDPYKNCLMQPILRYLDQLKGTGGNKPTKFIMMCAVRPDKCEDSMNSLKFGMSVKSSGQEGPKNSFGVAAISAATASRFKAAATKKTKTAGPRIGPGLVKGNWPHLSTNDDI